MLCKVMVTGESVPMPASSNAGLIELDRNAVFISQLSHDVLQRLVCVVEAGCMQRRAQRFFNAHLGVARGLQIHRAVAVLAAIGEFFPNRRRRVHDRRIIRERNRRLFDLVQRVEKVRPAFAAGELHQVVVAHRIRSKRQPRPESGRSDRLL